MTAYTLSKLSDECPWVVARMLWHQHDQNRAMTYSTELDSREYGKGFSWVHTTEGINFWKRVINGQTFDLNVVPSYKFGDVITLKYKEKSKRFIVLSWDLPHYAVWVMTERAFEMFMSREASENTRQDLRKMPISNIIWN